LKKLVIEFGAKNWSYIATKMHDHNIKRLGKQCRERWYNHLSPEVRKDPWTEDEDKIIIDNHNKLGSKWTTISNLLRGRTPNAIKNRWNSTLKRILSTGGTQRKRRAKSNPPPGPAQKIKAENETDDMAPDLDTDQSPLALKKRRLSDGALKYSPIPIDHHIESGIVSFDSNSSSQFNEKMPVDFVSNQEIEMIPTYFPQDLNFPIKEFSNNGKIVEEPFNYNQMEFVESPNRNTVPMEEYIPTLNNTFIYQGFDPEQEVLQVTNGLNDMWFENSFTSQPNESSQHPPRYWMEYNTTIQH